MDKLERKFGKYAIPRLTLVLLVIQAIGYAIYYLGGAQFLVVYLTLDPYAILHGQIWRLVTWLMMPTQSLISFLLIAALFYFPIGTQMEQVWGDFKYNLYFLLGMLFTILGAFLLYGYYGLSTEADALQLISRMLALSFSPYYVMLSIFFAFAATFPESMVLFMFLIPLKMKWLGLGYAAYLVYQVYQGTTVTRVVIVTSILNFAVFYVWSRSASFQRFRPKEVKRRQTYRQSVRMTPRVETHRCAICGATSDEFPDFEFRYCSKCNGVYEYCQEHLFTHTHVT